MCTYTHAVTPTGTYRDGQGDKSKIRRSTSAGGLSTTTFVTADSQLVPSAPAFANQLTISTQFTNMIGGPLSFNCFYTLMSEDSKTVCLTTTLRTL
jgi:hypothetical protein